MITKYFDNKIGDIGAKYLALSLSKLIKLTNLILNLGLGLSKLIKLNNLYLV